MYIEWDVKYKIVEFYGEIKEWFPTILCYFNENSIVLCYLCYVKVILHIHYNIGYIRWNICIIYKLEYVLKTSSYNQDNWVLSIKLYLIEYLEAYGKYSYR